MHLSKKQLKDIPVYDLGDLILRAVSEKDVLDMYQYGQDKEVTKMLTWGPLTDVKEAEYAIKNIFLPRPENNLPSAHAIVLKETNKMIGTCDFPSVDWKKKTATLGYCLNQDYWHKGYMTKVVKQIISFGFDYLKLDAIKVEHHPDNIGSKKVILKSGFTYIGETFHQSMNMNLPTYLLKKEDVTKRKKA